MILDQLYLRIVICMALQILVCSTAKGQSPFTPVADMDTLRDTIRQEEQVLVSFSVSWCMGCVMMDQGVWSDPSIQEFIEGLDSALRPDGSLEKNYRDEFDVEGYPELIMFVDGKEAGRLRGCWDVSSVLEWFDDPGRQVDPGDPWALPVGSVHDRAIDLLLERRFGEAAEFLSVFWVRSRHDAGMTDTLRWLRARRYQSMLKRVAQDDEGRVHIEKLLSSMGTVHPDADTDSRIVNDWIVLSLALEHFDRVDNWINAMLEEDEGIRQLSWHESVFDRLIEQDRYKDAGRVVSEHTWKRWVARIQRVSSGDPVIDAAPAKVIANEEQEASRRIRLIIDALNEAGRAEEASAIDKLREP
jgi:Thioredoxin